MLICDFLMLQRYGKRSLDEQLQPLGLGWREASVLLVLDQLPTLELPLLSRMLQMDKGNTSRLLSRMDSEGLLFRQVLQDDGRRRELMLSPRAQQMIPSVQQAMDQWEQTSFSGLTQEQVDTYKALNRQILKNLNEHGDKCR